MSYPRLSHFAGPLITTSLVALLALAGCDDGDACSAEGACVSDDDCQPRHFCRACACFTTPGDDCFDEDGDGFFRGTGCPGDTSIDCDDDDPNINPGASEICDDGVDNNCFGGADESCVGCIDAIGIGGTTECGAGACAGRQECTELGWGECLPRVEPRPETCGADGTGDGVDDDCNGIVDDGCICGCASDPDCADGAICVDCACVPPDGGLSDAGLSDAGALDAGTLDAS